MKTAQSSTLLGFPPRSEAGGDRPSVVVKRYGRRDWLLRRMLASSDALSIGLALLLAGIVGGRDHLGHFMGLGLLTVPAWVLLLRAYGLYDRDAKRINHSTIDDLPGVFHALFIGAVVLWAFYRLLLPEPFFLLEVVSFAVAAFLLMVAGRSLLRAGMRHRGPRNVLVVGAGDPTGLLVRKLSGHPEYAVRLVGRLEGAATRTRMRSAVGGAEEVPGLGVLGCVEDLPAVARAHEVDRVIISSEGLRREELLPLLRLCKELQLRVSLLPQVFDVIGPSVEVDEVEGVTLLGLDPPVLSRSSWMLKRSMDLAGSLVVLLAATPLLIAIAIAIKLDSSGPVFFCQDRVGFGGRTLRLLKFRTMVPDAQAREAELLHLSEDPNWLKLAHDPRITRVGRFLRMTSLDELPQLVNVLRGEMSLVGPRPLIPKDFERVTDWGRARLDLMPGITGLWQVLGRTRIPFEEMVKLDYLYVTNWSLWGDVRLLLRTLPAVLTQRGAN